MKILAIQLKRFGDLILTTPALAALRKRHPDARITLCIEDRCRELLPAMPFIDEAIVFNRKVSNAGLWWRLLSRHFDLCLDFTGNDRSALFSILSKANRRVAFKWVQKNTFRPLFYNEFVDSPVRERHTTDHYLDLLRAVGLRDHSEPITLELPEWCFKKGSQLVEECGARAPYVVMHPGTARLEKYWLPERWGEVADFCRRELGLDVMVTGSGDPVEQLHIAAMKSALSSPCCDLSGRLDMLTVGALIQGAALLLTVDSAAMHLGAAFRVPQVALFGKTNPFHWHPRHDRAKIVLAGRPEPMAEFKPHEKGGPMSQISTREVTDAIRAITH
jgi:ADP-heptose:LPS heptosyltransferase